MSHFHVLMYHEIIKEEDFDRNNASQIRVNQDYHDVLPQVLFCFLAEFEKQMEYLHQEGYVTLKLQDLFDFYYAGKPLPEKSVLLTFDDMYKSVLLYAYPILKKYNFNAVGFVVQDWLFEEEQPYSTTQSVCMSKAELDQMRDVFEYANHTKALHTREGERTAVQMVDRQSLAADLAQCEAFVDVEHVFAYPFGGLTDEVVRWLGELGFKLAFTSDPGPNDQSVDPLLLHRNGVLLPYTMDEFRGIFR